MSGLEPKSNVLLSLTLQIEIWQGGLGLAIRCVGVCFAQILHPDIFSKSVCVCVCVLFNNDKFSGLSGTDILTQLKERKIFRNFLKISGGNRTENFFRKRNVSHYLLLFDLQFISDYGARHASPGGAQISSAPCRAARDAAQALTPPNQP